MITLTVEFARIPELQALPPDSETVQEGSTALESVRAACAQVEVKGKHDYAITGDLTIRGVTRKATLNVSYLGQWETPWWEDGVDKGPRTRAGFLATTQINRQDFGVSWQDTMDRGGILVSNEIDTPSMLKRYWKTPDALLAITPVSQNVKNQHEQYYRPLPCIII